MNREHHEQSELIEFETRLRSLDPRPPLASATLVGVPDELKQVAAGRSWWSVKAGSPHAFYRTVGLSAAVGALAGAACTLLIVNWSGASAPHSAPSVAVATGEVLPSSAGTSSAVTSNAASSTVTPSTVAAVTEHSPESAIAADGGSNLAHAELQPQVTSVRRSLSDEYPIDWLDELRRLKPGTLGVGSRLVSQQSARLRAATKEPTSAASGLASYEPSAAASDVSTGVSHFNPDSTPLPQRQWMQQMLNSPNDFY